MLIRNLLLISFITILSNELPAAVSCPNVPAAEKNTRAVDLRREIGPIRDQDSVGWCYGFTSADLLSHYLYKKAQTGWRPFGNVDYRKPENMVSAVGVSSIFNMNNNKAFLDNMVNAKNADELSSRYRMDFIASGGNTYLALKTAREQGICFEKNLNSEDFSYVKDVRCAVDNNCSVREVLKIVYDSANEHCCQNYSLVKQMFPTLTVDQIKNILTATEKRDAIQRLVSLTCHQPLNPGIIFGDTKNPEIKNFRLHIPRPANKPGTNKPANPPAARPKNTYNAHLRSTFPSPATFLTADKLVLQIDEALNRGAPAAISYSPNFLVNPRAAGTEGHASSIVGKHFNPNTCQVEYILRNSWGANCGSMTAENPGYTSCVNAVNATKRTTPINNVYASIRACRTRFPPLPRNPRIRCEQATGYVFVARSDLQSHISGVTSLVEP